jgi:hypothetical protein
MKVTVDRSRATGVARGVAIGVATGVAGDGAANAAAVNSERYEVTSDQASLTRAAKSPSVSAPAAGLPGVAMSSSASGEVGGALVGTASGICPHPARMASIKVSTRIARIGRTPDISDRRRYQVAPE